MHELNYNCRGKIRHDETYLHEHELPLLGLLLGLLLTWLPLRWLSPCPLNAVLTAVQETHAAGGIGRHEVLHPHIHSGRGHHLTCMPHRHAVHPACWHPETKKNKQKNQ